MSLVKRRLPALVIAFVVVLAGCNRKAMVPEPSSAEGAAAVAAFYVGVAALEVGDDGRADAKLAEVTRSAPGEPAAWADWGVLALRQGRFDEAFQRLQKARELAPQDARLSMLAGVLESKRGRSAEAIAAFRDGVARAPSDPRIAYLLAQEVERQGGADSDAEVQRLLQTLATLRPDNLPVLLEQARLAARRGEAEALDALLAKVEQRAADWPAEAREQLASIRTLATQRDLRAAASRMSRLRNALTQVAAYREGLSVIKAPAGADVQPLFEPLALQVRPSQPAPADPRLAFAVGADGDRGAATWVGAIRLDDVGRPVVAQADGSELRLGPGRAPLPFPGGPGRVAPTPEGVLQIDFSYDFRTDLVLAGAGGVRLYRQADGGAFVDVTAATGLPRAVTEAAYTGAWAADVEADGDLDVVLGSADSAPVVLRNNGDGTFTPIAPFAGVTGLRQFAWLDLDGDGVCDVALIDGAGRLRVFMNQRQGRYVEREVPAGMASAKALAVGDASALGAFELVVVQADGAIVRLFADANDRWQAREIVKLAGADALAGELRLRAADLDNNGALDWILSQVSPGGAGRTSIWLGQGDGSVARLDTPPTFGAVFDIDDLTAGGRLDLLSIAAGRALVASSRSALAYHWQTVRPRAAQAFGDQRINPFGVGGAVEVRVGSRVARRPIAGPLVHFGLGTQERSDVVRILWPNGVVQAEFDAKADQSIAAEQRLKGSCPYMFAFDGKAMSFVKDTVPWGSAIGLRINNLGSAAIAATEEWYKIPGPQLAARDGYYDIRITGELWEVYYYDYLALVGVDHPVGTEVFVDERFVIPPVPPQITVVETPHPLRAAHDDIGRDVGAILRDLDDVLVDSFGRGQYQGVTREHHVELDLGPDAAVDGPLVLIAHGSLRPTDSSINVALSQGAKWVPHGLVLEVPDGRGGWKVARDNLGFPAGRKKTILLDLAKVFEPGTPRKVRLRTNLEVYWDKIEWARVLAPTLAKTFDIPAASADLHYRGYSAITVPAAGAPEIPHYDRLVATRRRWRDLNGYFTRFGDALPLLGAIDDRYVIMNAGDEMAFRFPAAPPPPSGWVRDFVVKGDGWIKDGDYNSTFSRTVLPLPHHGERDYTAAPGRLEDEWVYRRHPDDWQTYHTRYVGLPSVGRVAAAGE